jgi:hypothetical protein
MSELRSVLDSFAGDDLHGFSAGEVLERVALLVAVQNRVAAQLTRAVRHAEVTQAAEHDGLKSMRSWLVGHARLAPAEAMRIVRSGRALEDFPVLAAGFAEGSITAAQVNVVAEKVGPGEVARAVEQGIDLGAFDQAWAAVAAGSPHQVLAVAVQAFDDALDPDGRSRTRPRAGGCRSPSTPTAASPAGSTWMPSVGRRCRRRSSRSCRPTGRRVMTARVFSRTPMPSCSCVTTSWPPGLCRSCGR